MQHITARGDNLIGSYPYQKVGVVDFDKMRIPCASCSFRVENSVGSVLGVSNDGNRETIVPLCTLGVSGSETQIHLGGDEKVMRFVNPYMLESGPDFTYTCQSHVKGRARDIILTWTDNASSGDDAKETFTSKENLFGEDR